MIYRSSSQTITIGHAKMFSLIFTIVHYVIYTFLGVFVLLALIAVLDRNNVILPLIGVFVNYLRNWYDKVKSRYQKRSENVSDKGTVQGGGQFFDSSSQWED